MARSATARSPVPKDKPSPSFFIGGKEDKKPVFVDRGTDTLTLTVGEYDVVRIHVNAAPTKPGLVVTLLSREFLDEKVSEKSPPTYIPIPQGLAARMTGYPPPDALKQALARFRFAAVQGLSKKPFDEAADIITKLMSVLEIRHQMLKAAWEKIHYGTSRESENAKRSIKTVDEQMDAIALLSGKYDVKFNTNVINDWRGSRLNHAITLKPVGGNLTLAMDMYQGDWDRSASSLRLKVTETGKGAESCDIRDNETVIEDQYYHRSVDGLITGTQSGVLFGAIQLLGERLTKEAAEKCIAVAMESARRLEIVQDVERTIAEAWHAQKEKTYTEAAKKEVEQLKKKGMILSDDDEADIIPLVAWYLSDDITFAPTGTVAGRAMMSYFERSGLIEGGAINKDADQEGDIASLVKIGIIGRRGLIPRKR